MKKIFLTIFTTIILHITFEMLIPVQLIDLVTDIHHAFDNIKSLEVRAIFLGL